MLFVCFSQINVKTVEDLDVIQEELLGVPLLLRVWAEQQHQNTFTGEQPAIVPRFEGIEFYVSANVQAIKATQSLCI